MLTMLHMHTHDTNHLFNCSQVPTQPNTTSLVENSLEAAEVIQELEFRLASLRSYNGYFQISLEEG